MALPVFTENGVDRLHSVLHGFPVQGVSLFVHPPPFKLLGPGQVEGGGPGADALTVEVAVQRYGVGAVGRLETKECWSEAPTVTQGLTKAPGGTTAAGFRQTYAFDAIVHISEVICIFLDT